MKTPQQIKDEVEKEIERLTKELIGWEGKIVIEIKGTKFNVLENHNKFVEITNLDRLKAKLSILTEYDKSIKEMIEKVLSILKEGCGVNFVLEEQDCICGDDFEYEDKVKVLLCELCLDKIKRIELLSKIGEEKQDE